MNSKGQLRDVVQGICFLTHPSYISEARRQWVRFFFYKKKGENLICTYFLIIRNVDQQMLLWTISSFQLYRKRL